MNHELRKRGTSAAARARPLSAAETKSLFADLNSAPALVLAVSGGPDSTALLVLASRWRGARKSGPKLLAVTVDHGLRAESAAEAKQVARLARKLGVPHRTLRWKGEKPKSGLQEKARAARYGLLANAAAKFGASHLLTAHTLDDQAETVLMRLLRGSGPTGLAGMAREVPLPTFLPSPLPAASSPSPQGGEGRGEVRPSLAASRRRNPLTRHASRVDLSTQGRGDRSITLLRPFLDIPKARLIATLRAAKIPFADDPSNIDPRFTRVRLRALLPALAAEGLDAARLALLARRLRRAEVALASAADRARAALSLRPWSDTSSIELDAGGFAALPAEVALRLLGSAVTQMGSEGPAELAKLEDLLAALAATPPGARLRRTLAGAMVTLSPDRLVVERAPARKSLTTPRPGRPRRRKLR